MTRQADPITLDQVDEIFRRVSNWGRWGGDDQIGALNLITPEKRRQAAALVTEGISVTCSQPLDTQGGPENPNPVVHLMTRAGDIEGATGTGDYFAIASHGLAHTHLDALCHIFHKGQMYNGRPASMVTSTGALANSIESGQNGISSRGVLFDFPRLLSKEWMSPGEAIYPEDLDLAETAFGKVEPGDILLIRTGRHVRRRVAGTGGSISAGLAGLHVTSLPWLHDRGVALLGCDGVSDVTPSGLEGNNTPIHSVAIPGMGLHLLDNAQFDDLAEVCTRLNRWQFSLTIAPLRLMKGTASPVNPIAIF